MAHTPGPWKTTLAYDDPAVVDYDGKMIATAVMDVDMPSELDEVVANARLIAAAPELLAVLERCNNRWDDADEDDNPSLGRAIRAAIAKATGKESE